MRRKTAVWALAALALIVLGAGLAFAQSEDGGFWARDCHRRDLPDEVRETVRNWKQETGEDLEGLRREAADSFRDGNWDEYGRIMARLAEHRASMMEDLRDILPEDVAERMEARGGAGGPMLRGLTRSRCH